jgi:membrane protein DedA with SNARE-associated domain
LPGYFPLLTICSAFAQAEVNEHASPLTVIIFIVMFVGCCVGYIGFTWWGRNKKK